MRNNLWLENRLECIWNTHFVDVPKMNDVQIKFGQYARTRLGSIRQEKALISKPEVLNPKSQIIITGYFRDEIVPEYVVNLVIAHELCHYTHGFCSPHPQLYKNPHQGKVIDKELYKRGFGEEIKKQKVWIKNEWPKIIGSRVHRGRSPNKARFAISTKW